MNNPKTLTNAYLYELARTDIDIKSYVEIESFLKEKLDSFTKKKTEQVPADKVKAILIDKLTYLGDVDRITVLDKSGFQISTLGLTANGAGPVTVLIIDEGGVIGCQIKKLRREASRTARVNGMLLVGNADEESMVMQAVLVG